MSGETPQNEPLANSLDTSKTNSVLQEGPALKKAKSASGSATPVPIPQTVASQPSPVKQETQESLVRRSGKSVEEIIDGSDVRRFLNKTLTETMVVGLRELVAKWDDGQLPLTGGEGDRRVVVDELCSILQNVASRAP